MLFNSISHNDEYKNSSRLRVKNYRTTGLYKRATNLKLLLKRLLFLYIVSRSVFISN